MGSLNPGWFVSRWNRGLPRRLWQARRLATRGPGYWRWLKSLPYGVARRLTRRTAREYPGMEAFFRGGYGLEIGGPSAIFAANRLLPVYDRCRQLDNCNFAGRTIWHVPSETAKDKLGLSFARHFVAEATRLHAIPDGTYDFVLASHVLEHLANPLRAFEEWRRLLRPEGTMLVIVPDRRATFDHRRPPTPFEHIEADYRQNTGEDDLTHLPEILALHDLALDPGAGSRAQFHERSLDNAQVRALHHHVFVPETLVRMGSAARLRVLSVSIERPCHIIVLAQRVDAVELDQARLENERFLASDAGWRKRDPLGR